jgi:biotin carboxyl carrier protein
MGLQATLVPADAIEDDFYAGEALSVLERIVLAPAAGVFRPHPPQTVTTEGEIVHRGQEIGVIESAGVSIPVQSQFTGLLMGIMVLEGKRVRLGEPVVWLRTL